MAKKPIDPLEDPPTASSSEEEEEVESSAGEEDDEEASSSDDDESKDPIKPPSSAVTIAVPSKPNVSSSAAAADSGSDAETDSDSDTDRPSNPPLTQGSNKPISAAAKPKKKATETETEAAKSSAVLALPPAKSGTKRPIESTSKESTNPKRAKKAIVVTGEEEKKIGGGEDSKKPAAFQRLWTEEDEIAVLQGMIDFKEETGKSFYEDTNCYYDFIKKSISFEVSKNQFMDKLRSLKKKYMGKEKPSFNKPHEQKSFKLSKFIWGPDGLGLDTAVKSNGGGGSVSKKKKTNSSSSSAKKLDSVKQELSFAAVSPNGKKAVVVVEEKGDKGVSELACGVVVKRGDWFGNSFLVKAIASSGLDEYCVKQRWSSVSEENKKKVEEKMKVLQDKEIEFVTEKTALMSEVMSMICEANKKKA